MKNIYTKMLNLILFNKIYDTRSMNFALDSGSYTSSLLSKAIQEKHIKKKAIRKTERTVHKITFFTLTKKGLTYLSENGGTEDIFPLSDAIPHICMIKQSDQSIDRQLKIIRDTTALTLAEKAGAKVLFENYKVSLRDKAESEEDNPDKIPAEDFIRSNLDEPRYEELNLYNNSMKQDKILFHNSMVVKSCAGNSNSYVTARDYLAGRYSGIIDSEKKSIMLFVAPMFGMRWDDWIIEKERAAYILWNKRRGMQSYEQQQRSQDCAALIVDNPRQFSNLFLNVDHAKRDKDRDFGGAFDHFYILPMTKIGAKHLNWLMKTDDNAVVKTMLKSAVDSGSFVENNGSMQGEFPLIDSDGNKTALGIHLDAKMIIRLKKRAEDNPSESFSVICYEWQMPYYESALPENVEIITINEQ